MDLAVGGRVGRGCQVGKTTRTRNMSGGIKKLGKSRSAGEEDERLWMRR
jgi:hypothetical protein